VTTIRGVLLGTLEEQIAGGDTNPVDPRLIKFDLEERPVRVSLRFESDQVVGKATRVWREDGRLMFEATVDGDLMKQDKAAIGFIGTTAEAAYDLEMKNRDGYTIKGGKLFEIGLTDDNENRNQPPYEVVEE
jgi:hypothetical protein